MELKVTCDCDCFPKECNKTKEISITGLDGVTGKEITEILTVLDCDNIKRLRAVTVTRSEVATWDGI